MISPIGIDVTVPWSLCRLPVAFVHCAQTAGDIDTISFAHDSPGRAIIWLTSVNLFLPKCLPQIDPSPVKNLKLSVVDIRRQIAAEWLEIAQWSRSFKSPTLYDLSFPKCGSQMHPRRQGSTSQRVLPPGEYNRRYRPSDVTFCQVTLALVFLD